MRQTLLKIFLWFAGGLVLLQSLTTTLLWWKGEITHMTALDWLWVLLLPPMLYLYFRHVSIFGKPAPPCLLPEERREKPHGD
jgi:hypothetical protein